MSGSKKLTLTRAIFPFLIVIAVQMLFAGASLSLLTMIRANIIAASLWSTSQTQSVYFLSCYAANGDEQAFRLYKAASRVMSLGRAARMAMDAPIADPDTARDDFIKIGVDSGGAAGMIWGMFHFGGYGPVRTILDRWVEANAMFTKLDALADTIHSDRQRGSTGGKTRGWLAEIDTIRARLTPIANDAQAAQYEAARLIDGILMAANCALALCLAALTIWRMQRFLKQRQLVESELAWQASHDPLTGIANRRGLEDRLSEILVADRDQTHALIFLDIDQFKVVNDTCGHAAGDALLQRICVPLQASLRDGELMARLGGDEFSILLEGHGVAESIAIAEALLVAIQNMDFVWDQRTFRVTASVGLVHINQGLMTPQEMMRAADMACFMAKEKGRNRVHVHRAEDQDLIRHADEMDWVQRIHQALKDDRFCLYAQEIAPLGAQDDGGAHLEILIRLLDESGVIVPPASFLPAAERFGLMGLIDRWVVRTAFRRLAERNLDPHAESIGCCAINLSGATIGDQSFLTFLKMTFAETGISPGIVCFEITETSAITNFEAAKVFVSDLRAFGCRFSLDDFGSGMSSFGYLKHLPVDFLKIDGSFVRNMLNNKVDRAMVEMVKNMGHIMGQRIIAEFVESDELTDALRAIGVDYGQGYGIAKPRPFDLRFRSVGATREEGALRLSA